MVEVWNDYFLLLFSQESWDFSPWVNSELDNGVISSSHFFMYIWLFGSIWTEQRHITSFNQFDVLIQTVLPDTRLSSFILDNSCIYLFWNTLLFRSSLIQILEVKYITFLSLHYCYDMNEIMKWHWANLKSELQMSLEKLIVTSANL